MNAETNEPLPSPPVSLGSLWLFFVVVFGWSWAFWILAAVLGLSVEAPAGRMLLFVGLLGPLLGGVGFACFTLSAQEWRDYRRRLVDPRRIGAKWFLVIFVPIPALMVVAVLLDAATGGPALALAQAKAATLLATPTTAVAFLITLFMMGPIPEELGWRGYALVRLQARWSALTSSLILSAIWALYHLPLFFMPGSFHHSQGAGSVWFWLFMVQVAGMAVVMTWIFNNTRGSTLGAILFHFTLRIHDRQRDSGDKFLCDAVVAHIGGCRRHVAEGLGSTAIRWRNSAMTVLRLFVWPHDRLNANRSFRRSASADGLLATIVLSTIVAFD